MLRPAAATAAIFVAGAATSMIHAQLPAPSPQTPLEQFESTGETVPSATRADVPIISVDDPRQAFNQALEMTRQDKLEEAEALLLAAAASAEPQLVADSHYNLGCLDVRRTRALLLAKPGDAVGEVRTQAMQLADDAAEHFRDCLQIDPDHAAARKNLELLLLWKDRILDTWRTQDRQRHRETTELLSLLDWIQQQQRELRRRTGALSDAVDSQQRRRAMLDAAEVQRELADEIGFLSQTIRRTLESAVATSPRGANAEPDREAVERMMASFEQLTSQARDAMLQAAEKLAAREPAAADAPQSASLPLLNAVFETLAPFDLILEKAIRTQRQLIANTSQAGQPSPAGSVNSAPEIDHQDLVEFQSLVASWAIALTHKAQQELEDAPHADESERRPDRDARADGVQMLDPHEHLRRAVELAPRVGDLAEEAAANLALRQWDEALPEQREALRLLELIAQQQRQQHQQQQDEQQQDQPQQPSSPEDQPPQRDESQGDSGESQQPRSGQSTRQPGDRMPPDDDPSSRDDSPEPPDSPEARDTDPQESNPNSPRESDPSETGQDVEKPRQDPPPPGREQPANPPTKDAGDAGSPQSPAAASPSNKTGAPVVDDDRSRESSRQKAELLLSKVRQREREHRERQLELQRLLHSRVRVEKDW